MKRIIKLIISICFQSVSWLWALMRKLLGKKSNTTCVVLCYHGVKREMRGAFQRQMEDLLRLARPIAGGSKESLAEGAHHVMLTFDDAFASVAENAVPCLVEKQIPATIFIPSGYLGREPGWHSYHEGDYGSERVMTAEQLRAQPSGLITFGSHTITHPKLWLLDDSAASRELCGSREELETALGRPIRLFAFPYGVFNARLLDLAQRAGYERVFTSLPTFAYTVPDEYATGRVEVAPDDWRLEFRLKLLGAYRWLPVAMAIKRRFKGSVTR